MQAWREFGTTAVSVQKIKSHQALDDIVDGSSVRDVLGNERGDEVARIGAQVQGHDNSDMAAAAVHHKLVKRVAMTAATVLAIFPDAKR